MKTMRSDGSQPRREHHCPAYVCMASQSSLILEGWCRHRSICQTLATPMSFFSEPRAFGLPFSLFLIDSMLAVCIFARPADCSINSLRCSEDILTAAICQNQNQNQNVHRYNNSSKNITESNKHCYYVRMHNGTIGTCALGPQPRFHNEDSHRATSTFIE